MFLTFVDKFLQFCRRQCTILLLVPCYCSLMYISEQMNLSPISYYQKENVVVDLGHWKFYVTTEIHIRSETRYFYKLSPAVVLYLKYLQSIGIYGYFDIALQHSRIYGRWIKCCGALKGRNYWIICQD